MNVPISVIISPNVEGIDKNVLEVLTTRYTIFQLSDYDEIDRLYIIDPGELFVIDLDNFLLSGDVQSSQERFCQIVKNVKYFYPNACIISYVSEKRKDIALELQSQDIIDEILYKPFEINVFMVKLDDAGKLLSLQRQLKATHANYDRNKKMFHRFFATISHQLRTPINSLSGFIQLMSNSTLTIKQQEYIGKMRDSSNEILNITNILEDTAKLNLLEMTVDNVDFNINGLLTNISNIAGLQAFDKDIQLSFKIDPGTTQYLNGPVILIEKVLINTTEAIIRCSSHGSMTFLVRQESIDTENDKMVLGVRILSECLETNEAHLMNISRILNDVIAEDEIGEYNDDYNLLTSKKITNMLHDHISFSYIDNDTVSIDLLFNCNTFIRNENTMLKIPESISGMKVAIVDSNNTSRDMLNMMLDNMSFRVTCLASGSEVINEIESSFDEPYKLIIISQNTSDFSIIKTIKNIQNSFTIKDKPKIIITSAYTHEQLYRDLDNLSIDGFLAKPIVADVMLEMIISIFQPKEDKLQKEHKSLTLNTADNLERVVINNTLESLKGINQNIGLMRVNGNLEIYRIILLKFYNTNQDTMARIRQAFETGNIEEAKKFLHNTKDLAINIGATNLAESIDNILCYIEADRVNYAVASLDSLQNEFQTVLSSIKTLDKRKNYREKIISNDDHIIINELINLEIMLREENYAVDDLVSSISKHLENTSQKNIFDVVVMYIKNCNPDKAIDLLLAIKKSIQDAM